MGRGERVCENRGGLAGDQVRCATSQNFEFADASYGGPIVGARSAEVRSTRAAASSHLTRREAAISDNIKHASVL